MSTGSTAMGEELDPEDMRALLGRYFEIAREVVAAHGGTLEKFIGDAVMAVFGLPTAHDDDAARALASALALRDQVRDDPRTRRAAADPAGTEHRRGRGGDGRLRGDDFLVTGDAVNVAARLQQGAESWEIVCAERTVRAAGEGFAFGPPWRWTCGARAPPFRRGDSKARGREDREPGHRSSAETPTSPSWS